MTPPTHFLTIGTRGSAHAIWQANFVTDQMETAHPQLSIRIKVISTRGDQILERMPGASGRILNIGHGILPETPVDTVCHLVDFVHEFSTVHKIGTGAL